MIDSYFYVAGFSKFVLDSNPIEDDSENEIEPGQFGLELSVRLSALKGLKFKLKLEVTCQMAKLMSTKTNVKTSGS